MAESIRIVVSGRVHGVGFRQFVLRAAREMGLVGWVRNRPDGTVEIVARGDSALLARLVELTRQGPGRAHVTDVQLSAPADAVLDTSFSVRRD